MVVFFQELRAPFFIIILISPPVPSASYFDEGLLIISIFLISLAEIDFRKLLSSSPVNSIILPSIITREVPFPNMLIALFCTTTPGAVFIALKASPPTFVTLFSRL
ncbi:hypothetical protein D3C85_1341890 [compost metagenome]